MKAFLSITGLVVGLTFWLLPVLLGLVDAFTWLIVGHPLTNLHLNERFISIFMWTVIPTIIFGAIA